MKKFFRHTLRLLDLLDISPIDGGSIPKLFIYVAWGLNAALFLGEDIMNKRIFENVQVLSVSSASNCTVLKKVNADADLFENIEIVNSNEFFITSSCDNELVTLDVVNTRKSRAPPAGTALS